MTFSQDTVSHEWHCFVVFVLIVNIQTCKKGIAWSDIFMGFINRGYIEACENKTCRYIDVLCIRVITKWPNSEQSSKWKVKTHEYINRQNQSTTRKLGKP